MKNKKLLATVGVLAVVANMAIAGIAFAQTTTGTQVVNCATGVTSSGVDSATSTVSFNTINVPATDTTTYTTADVSVGFHLCRTSASSGTAGEHFQAQLSSVDFTSGASDHISAVTSASPARGLTLDFGSTAITPGTNYSSNLSSGLTPASSGLIQFADTSAVNVYTAPTGNYYGVFTAVVKHGNTNGTALIVPQYQAPGTYTNTITFTVA